MDCPICQSMASEVVYELKYPRRLYMHLCNDCGLVYQKNPLCDEELIHYYNNNCIYHAHGASSRSARLNNARHLLIDPVVNDRLVNIDKKNIVDVGCGFGDFLSTWDESEFDRLGIELNPDRAAYAQTQYGLEIVPCDIESANLTDSSVHIVSAFGLLEHLDKPHAFFKTVRRCLTDGGLLIVNVPDLNDPIIAISDFFHVEHILYFTHDVLVSLADEHGMKLVKYGRTTHDYPDITCVFTKVNEESLEKDKVPSVNPKVVLDVMDRYKRKRKVLVDTFTKQLQLGGVFDQLSECAIYGAGEHTVQLLDAIPELSKITEFYDSDTEKHGDSLVNGLIKSIDMHDAVTIKTIIISSRQFEDEIYNFLKLEKNVEAKIVRLYHNTVPNETAGIAS